MERETRERTERSGEKSRERSRGVKITCTFHAEVIVRNFAPYASSPLHTADNAVCTKSRLLKSLAGHVIDLCLVKRNKVPLYISRIKGYLQGRVIKIRDREHARTEEFELFV